MIRTSSSRCGGPLRYSTFRTRVWKPAVAAAGLQTSLSIHHLRHTAAALMIREGAHMELVRDQLGHSSIGVTQRYAHLYPGAAEEVAARLDRAYREGARWVGVGLGAS
jgi:site-specific recombinase XerD